jgi:hypothetical protein
MNTIMSISIYHVREFSANQRLHSTCRCRAAIRREARRYIQNEKM